jgi:hypothetical protein
MSAPTQVQVHATHPQKLITSANTVPREGNVLPELLFLSWDAPCHSCLRNEKSCKKEN